MRKLLSLFILILFLLASIASKAGSDENDLARVTLSGYVHDQSNGELLIGVTVYCVELKTGAVTNMYGFYSLSLAPGKYTIRYSYVGFNSLEKEVRIDKNLTMDINLSLAESLLGEVVITGKRTDENVRAPEMSLVKMDMKTIRKVPALLGEIDIIKVLQLLPGVQSTSEGSTGFSVRGGNSDQNLILLDEATIHNASHLMGFFSVFNNDAIKDVTLYKGDIPAAYGGRLSSLLDVRMKDGNAKKISGTGSVGTVSSKLTLEGPIIKDRTTFLVSGRRTYADLFLPFAKDKEVRDNKLYFYDLNLKLTHVINENNRLYISGYAGHDTFKNQFASMGFGNQTGLVRWNHLFSKKLFFNLSLIYSNYNYELGTPEGDANSFKWTSKMRDYSARFDFSYYLSDKHMIRFGATTMYHEFFPGTASGLGTESAFAEFKLPAEYALEHSLYGSDEYKLNPKLTIKYGLRIALFQNIGPGTYYNYDKDYNKIDSIVYKKGDLFNSYTSFEPRFAFTYLVNDVSSIKGSYSHAAQFLTLAQNSTAGTPLDIWFPATPNVKPQVCDQVAMGYFRNFHKNMYEASVEVYYKKYRNVIDFRDHASLLLNQYIEGELRIGKGYSYGVETMLRKNEGLLTGWVSYTYSRAFRVIPEINNGDRYNAPYDKPHAVNIVVNYDFSKRVSASATWVYATGLPVTFPTGRAVIGNAIIPIYSNRNAYRMPDYHRMDLSVSLKGKDKPGKKWHGEWNLSVYNAYNRHNAWSISFTQDAVDPNVTYAEKTYLFAVIPALTYNFKF
ncbi:MAG: TonB-dependent receptor [Bacteroidales bacterium]|nr:TonB-dependent receptor [Bacteroidales bacterium]